MKDCGKGRGTALLVLNPWERLIGPNRYLAGLLERLPSLARATLVVVPEEGPAAEEYRGMGCRVAVLSATAQVRARFSLGALVGFLWDHTVGLVRLLGLLRRERPSVVLSNSEQLLVGDLGGRLAGVPTIKVFHAATFHYRLGRHPRLMRRYLRLLTMFSSRVVAVSETLGWLLKAGGVPPGKVSVVPNAIDVGRMERASLGELPGRLNALLEGRGPILLNVGKISPMKGQDQLVEVVDAVRKEFPRVLCLAVGGTGASSGMENAGAYMDKIGERIREAGLEDALLFVGEVEDLPPLMRRADLYLQTSWTESFCRAAAEALAVGTPVVAYASGALPEVIGPGGVTVAPGDAAALSREVISLCRDEEHRRVLGAAGKRHVMEHFGVEAVAERFLNLVEPIASTRGKT